MPDQLLSRDLEIRNKKGLHARASAKFVQCASQFNAELTVTRDGQSVSGTSIMGLMMLGAGIGSTIRIDAAGPDAEVAMTAIAGLIDELFGEE